ncbi:uncharacterized protein N7482_003612 [Penicillium canariense]|uniref:AAA+ ATPase domain-containing protein n=1 Tax=Penicillium canariense TaxID=189055 RepID=A0A9W9I713_9EURO|nr:uncharacterized protein N7482_003612 [Penicillium canariense]KAJ5168018.1 hypothetical protein N7482_003612 [Penicillium canariense]
MAVAHEHQNNEEEALRSWRSALETIYHHNARRVPSNYTPKSETERALQDSIRALEVQCSDRVNLLEALRESRKESAEANGNSKEPTTLIKGKFAANLRRSSSSNSHPGWIGDGTIPAFGYTDLSKPAAIPGRPAAPPMAKQNPESLSLLDDAHVLDSPTLRVNSNSSEKTKSRGSSPERRKTMLTTLRSTDGKKNGKKSKISTKKKEKESRPAASTAAGMAWGSIYRAPSSEKTLTNGTLAPSRQMAAGDRSVRREPEPRSSSGDEPSSARSRPRRDSPADRISPADWREPHPSLPSRPSPRTSAQPSPRKLQPPSESYRPLPSGSVVQPDPKDFTPTPTPSPVSKPSVKPKPVGLRSSLQPPSQVPQATRSEGSLRATSPRQDRDGDVSGSKPRTNFSGEYERQQRFATQATPGQAARDPPSSDQESWEQRSSEGEAADEDDEDDNNDLTKILSKLPKGVDLQSARQILNDIVVRGDEVHWDDIAGLDGAKKALKEAVVYPFLRPDLFSGLREPARGMLLFGPPGTGKTMLARGVATESKSTFFSVSSSSLTSKWHGESEKLVRALFGLAKVLAPSIIFVDEIDSLLSARSSGSENEASRRSKTEFLIQWSDLQRAAAGREQTARDRKEGDASRVLVLAATNLPWDIDEAARRRFVRRQYIPLPEHHVREQQLRKLLSHQHHELSDADIQVLVHVTEGFSGSDITALAKDAAMGPLRNLGEALLHTPMDQIRPIKFQDFEASLYSIRPSVSPDGLRRYEEWAREFGERGG